MKYKQLAIDRQAEVDRLKAQLENKQEPPKKVKAYFRNKEVAEKAFDIASVFLSSGLNVKAVSIDIPLEDIVIKKEERAI